MKKQKIAETILKNQLDNLKKYEEKNYFNIILSLAVSEKENEKTLNNLTSEEKKYITNCIKNFLNKFEEYRKENETNNNY